MFPGYYNTAALITLVLNLKCGKNSIKNIWISVLKLEIIKFETGKKLFARNVVNFGHPEHSVCLGYPFISSDLLRNCLYKFLYLSEL